MPTTASASIDRQIGAIAIPAALALATEPLAELCDTAIVGSLGTTALGGVAIAVRVVSFASTVFIFLMFATTTAVARHLGAGDTRRAAETLDSVISRYPDTPVARLAEGRLRAMRLDSSR